MDLHCHVVPPVYRQGAPRAVQEALPAWSDVALSAHMDRFGIDAAVLSVGPPGVYFGDGESAAVLARRTNEWLASFVAGRSDRYGALAVLPMPEVGASLSELEYALDVLELDGAVLYSNHEGHYLGDQLFEPVLAELDRRGAYVFVHPAGPPYPLPLPHHPMWLYEFPFDTTRCIADLIYSGTLDRHQAIRFQFAHLGGAALSLAHRLASLATREPEHASAASRRVGWYLERLYFDTGLCNYTDALASAERLAGPGRIGFGSDWPYADLPAYGSDPAPGLAGLGAKERAVLDADAAAALVPRLGRSV
ncbi:amidohydrolase family protein [Streptomyces mirabilis]|uniref:amidohydrolase family protein n=1 Tax=Streptomyces mirabilis TaxID=68239 RepID=UPI0036AEC44B